jgi:hypothetical protein
MADEIVSGLKGIKQELKAVQDQMIGLSAGSDEFIKLSQKAGELRDRMKDVKEAVNSQAGPAISNFGNNLSIARGQLMELDLEGFSESIKRMGVNVASINFGMLKDGLSAAGSALVDIGATIITNPIMLLGGVLAGVVMYWDEITAAIFKTNQAQKLNAEITAEMNKAISGELVSLEKNKALLNDANLSQEKRVAIINELKKTYPDYLGNINAETISNDKLSAALSNVNKALFLKYEIQAREKTLQPLFEKRLQLENDLAAAEQARVENQNKIAKAQQEARNAGGAAAYANYQEIEKIGNLETGQVEKIKADIDATSKLINDSIAKISSTQLELDKFTVKSNEKTKESTVKTQKETTKKVVDEKIDRNKILAQYNQEQAEDDIALAAEVADKNAAMSQALTDKERANAVELHGEKKSLVADLNEVEKEVFNARLERSDIETQHQIENEEKLRAKKFAARDAALKLAKEGEEAIANVGAAYFATKMSRIDRETKEGAAAYEVLAKKQFEFNKKMQLAGAIIDLARGINSSLAAAPVAIGPAPNPAGIASLAFVTATGLANIAKIAATKYQSSTAPGGTSPSPNLSGGGGGGQSPAALNLSAIQGNTNTAPIQSYVLAGQVSSAQQAEFKIKNTASILGGG